MNARGFTLLELMIACAIGTIITGGVFVVMTNQTQTNRVQSDIVDGQQSLRAAIVTVIDTVSDAGFQIPGGVTFGSTTTEMRDNFTGTDIYGTCPGTDVFTVRSRNPVGFWRVAAGTLASVTLQTGVDTVGTTFKDRATDKGALFLAYPRFGKPVVVQAAIAKPELALGTSQLVTLSTGFNDSTEIVLGTDVHEIKSTTFRVICANDSNGNEQRTLIASHGTDFVAPFGVVDKNDIAPIAPDVEDMQVEFLYDNDVPGNDLPDAASPVTFPLTEFERQRVKAVRITVVGRTPRPLHEANFVSDPIDLPGRPVWTKATGAAPFPILYRYGRRLLRETILLNNRNTRQPEIYNYLSNRWL